LTVVNESKHNNLLQWRSNLTCQHQESAALSVDVDDGGAGWRKQTLLALCCWASDVSN